MQKLSTALILYLCCILLACKSFYSKEDESMFANVESGTYSMLKDVTVEGRSLKRGQKVKLITVHDEEAIKVYAYSAEENVLKAERVIILYMFADEFSKQFNSQIFLQRLREIVVRR